MAHETSFSDFRKNSELTLDGVAALFNVDRTTILRWEKGEPPIPVKRLDEVERVTGISRDKLRPDIFGPTPAARVSA